MSKNIFLQSFYKLRNKRPILSSLRRDHLPLRSRPWKELLNTCLRFKKVPHIDFLELHGKQTKKIQKTHKSKIVCSGWMQDMEQWFGGWDATHLIHDTSLDSSVNEAFLQPQCIITCQNCGGSHFAHYTTIYNYKKCLWPTC